MLVAGIIAGLGVITGNQILIVGAKLVSPDLLPSCATCVALVGRQIGLAARSFVTLLTFSGTVTLALQRRIGSPSR